VSGLLTKGPVADNSKGSAVDHCYGPRAVQRMSLVEFVYCGHRGAAAGALRSTTGAVTYETPSGSEVYSSFPRTEVRRSMVRRSRTTASRAAARSGARPRAIAGLLRQKGQIGCNNDFFVAPKYERKQCVQQRGMVQSGVVRTADSIPSEQQPAAKFLATPASPPPSWKSTQSQHPISSPPKRKPSCPNA
jgi:hypothetical protein